MDLILRLSWGCGKKEAYIPHQKDFSVVGIYEADIKEELDWLEVSKIIIREGTFYWFNKNFDEWQISRVSHFKPKKLSELLSLNLNGNRPELSKTLSSENENLAKRKEKTLQNTKLPTPNLATPKESIKESIYIDTSINKEKNNFDLQIEAIEKELQNPDLKSWQRKKLHQAIQDLRKQDPDKFIKGKLGHMVQR